MVSDQSVAFAADRGAVSDDCDSDMCVGADLLAFGVGRDWSWDKMVERGAGWDYE